MPRCVIYIDTETTGVDINKNSVFQIAGIIQKDGVTVDKFDFRMKPWYGEPIDPYASKITGVTDEVLSTFPDQREVFDAFIRKLDEHIVKTSPRVVKRMKEEEGMFEDPRALFAGYNSRFDSDFVRKWFELNGRTYDYSSYFYPNVTLDVMQLAAFMMLNDLDKMTDFKLGTVHKILTGTEATFSNAHNAFADIEATERIYRILREKGGVVPFADSLGIGEGIL